MLVILPAKFWLNKPETLFTIWMLKAQNISNWLFTKHSKSKKPPLTVLIHIVVEKANSKFLEMPLTEKKQEALYIAHMSRITNNIGYYTKNSPLFAAFSECIIYILHASNTAIWHSLSVMVHINYCGNQLHHKSIWPSVGGRVLRSSTTVSMRSNPHWQEVN